MWLGTTTTELSSLRMYVDVYVISATTPRSDFGMLTDSPTRNLS
jgi:hypothetical protein